MVCYVQLNLQNTHNPKAVMHHYDLNTNIHELEHKWHSTVWYCWCHPKTLLDTNYGQSSNYDRQDPRLPPKGDTAAQKGR